MLSAVQIVATSSNAGKSYLVAAFCRLLLKLGYKVAPFKAQNMALNAAVTLDGLELGRAQAMQAEAAGLEPDVRMNPILLKPSGERRSQLIVLGEVRDEVDARYWRDGKNRYWPEVLEAFADLAADFDFIVVEGAGSSTEINLDLYDFVNLGLAKRLAIPAILVGDIDRGGVFASLYGSVKLLPDDLQATLAGFLINKFRGDVSLLEAGIADLERLCGCPSLGVIPYVPVDLDDEDSLSDRLLQKGRAKHPERLQVVIPRLPRLANFTDFTILEAFDTVELRYVERPEDLAPADLIILPGSKATITDYRWLKQSGLAAAIQAAAAKGLPIWGICGGYQMLGERLDDREGLESGAVCQEAGLGLLPIQTVFGEQKVRGRYQDQALPAAGLGNCPVAAYALHQGQAALLPGAAGEPLLAGGGAELGWALGEVRGTFYHGIFDAPGVAEALLEHVAEQARARGRAVPQGPFQARDGLNYRERRERAYERLAETLAQHLDWAAFLPRFLPDAETRLEFETRLRAYLDQLQTND